MGNFDILDQVCPKRVIPIKKENSLTKFAQKENFPSKTEKSHLCLRLWFLLTILNFSSPGPTDTTVF